MQPAPLAGIFRFTYCDVALAWRRQNRISPQLDQGITVLVGAAVAGTDSL